MSQIRLKRVLSRFKCKDYAYLLEKCDLLSDARTHSINLESMKKDDFINLILTTVSRKKWKRSIPLLELFYIQIYSHSRIWHVLRMVGAQGPACSSRDRDMEATLEKHLSLYFTPELSMIHQQGTNWMRIQAYDDAGKTARSAPLYLVHHPVTNVILATNLRGKYAESVMQSVMLTLGCTQAEQLELKGHDTDSLIQMVINKYFKDAVSQRKLRREDPTGRRGLKRKASDEGPQDDRIVCENLAEKRHRAEKIERTFGSNVLPTLETLQYTLETPFRGLHYAPAMKAYQDQKFHCKVKFSGSDVLEGTRQLGLSGLARLPMRDHMAKVQSLARNSFVLRSKSGSSRSMNTSQNSILHETANVNRPKRSSAMSKSPSKRRH